MDDLVIRLNEFFTTSIDNPFMGSINKISGYFAEKYKIWTLQIEINCGITNYRKGIGRYNQLLDILTEWVECIEKKSL